MIPRLAPLAVACAVLLPVLAGAQPLGAPPTMTMAPAGAAPVPSPEPAAWRIEAGAGAFSLLELSEAFWISFGTGFADSLTGEHTEVDVDAKPATLLLRAGKDLAPRLHVALTGIYLDYEVRITSTSGYHSVGTRRVRGLLVDAYLLLARSGGFRLETGLGLGAAQLTVRDERSTSGASPDEESVLGTAFQLHALRASLGRDFGVYGELGLGFQGLFQGGVFARL